MIAVILSSTEITGIFITHYGCCRYVEVLLKLITTSKSQSLFDLPPDLVIYWVNKETHILPYNKFGFLVF